MGGYKIEKPAQIKTSFGNDIGRCRTQKEQQRKNEYILKIGDLEKLQGINNVHSIIFWAPFIFI